MNTTVLTLLVYGVPAAILVLAYVAVTHARQRRDDARLQQAIADGLTEPASLHPRVDPARCVGSGTCARACPEEALGIVDGKAVLVSPTACIGHGACAAACPVDAITLVFGTERRGIDIPAVSPTFESNVPGIFVAGELGGMGLIRKAAEQGRQAVRTIAARPRAPHEYDVLIVGAGPAGIAAGLAAIEAGLRYRLIEQESGLGGSVFHYPRNKVAMTAPVDLPLVGPMRFVEVTKERLLAFWEDIVLRTRLTVSADEQLERIEPLDQGFRIHTSRGEYSSAAVLLAIGRRGTPRKLGVPGEALPKVTYRLVDASQYRGEAVLVVGGGDSAIEAALAVAEAGARTTLAYRGSAFNRIKAENRRRLAEDAPLLGLEVRTETEVASISATSVRLVRGNDTIDLANDAVIVCAGGVLPTDFLRSIGIRFDTKHGTA